MRAALASLAVTAAMLATRGPSLEDLDGANFLHALRGYDLSLHQPHFPGYPVYVAATRLADSVVHDPVLALQLPGALAWGVALWALHHAVSRRLGRPTAWFVWALTALSPLCWLTAGRTGSDALGLALLVLCGAALSQDDTRGRSAAGLLAGLTLGVRLSYAPAVLGLAWIAARRAPTRGVPADFTAAATAGVLVWTVPFVAWTREDLAANGLSFVTGHFVTWGGTAFVEGQAPAARATSFLSGLFTGGLGFGTDPAGLAATLLVGSALLLGALRLPRAAWPALLAVAVPYGLWLFVGQNPDKPRHLLPLIPLLTLVAGTSLVRWPRPVALATVAALAAVTLPVALAHHRTRSPAAQLARWLEATHRPDQVLLFAGQSARVVGALSPGYRVEYAADKAQMQARLDHTGAPPVLVWTDEVWMPPLAPAATLRRDPRVNPHLTRIRVYSVVPANDLDLEGMGISFGQQGARE